MDEFKKVITMVTTMIFIMLIVGLPFAFKSSKVLTLCACMGIALQVFTFIYCFFNLFITENKSNKE